MNIIILLRIIKDICKIRKYKYLFKLPICKIQFQYLLVMQEVILSHRKSTIILKYIIDDNTRNNSIKATLLKEYLITAAYNFAIISADSTIVGWITSFLFLLTDIFILMTLGLFSLASGCLILLYHPYELLFQWKIVFTEGGETFELWRKPEVNLYLKIYLFNVTNRDEYLSGEEPKLRFQEVGPYVYK